MEKIKSQRQRGGERLWVKKKRRVHQGKAIKCVGCSPPLSLASVTPAVLLSRCCCRCSRRFCFITLLLTSGCGTRKRLACLPSDWCISAKVLTVQRTAVSANWKKEEALWLGAMWLGAPLKRRPLSAPLQMAFLCSPLSDGTAPSLTHSLRAERPFTSIILRSLSPEQKIGSITHTHTKRK